jgi:hypothetical protein
MLLYKGVRQPLDDKAWVCFIGQFAFSSKSCWLIGALLVEVAANCRNAAYIYLAALPCIEEASRRRHRKRE